jgi:predicted transposase YbfD/YdcC
LIRQETALDRFFECFAEVPDPRADNSQHDLTEILFIALLAGLCGASSCSDMEEFGLAKEKLLREILTLPHGIPSHDTFSRVFRLIDPVAFEAAFRLFMTEFSKGANIAKPKGVVALDGKALRRGYESGQAHMPRVMVTAWATETRMSLAAKLATDGNEAKAALDLVELLALKGCVVTGDALHCHRKMAASVIAKGGDYVLAVKNNQPSLLKAAVAAIEQGVGSSTATTTSAAHGREELREAMVAKAPLMAVAHDFPGLAAVARIVSKRGPDEVVTRYFLMSRLYKADRLLAIVRAHWGIESTLHWTLDVVQREDEARNRKDNGPANLAILRRLANNVARAHPDKKTSLRRKLLRAGWQNAFLFDLIRHMR